MAVGRTAAGLDIHRGHPAAGVGHTDPAAVLRTVLGLEEVHRIDLVVAVRHIDLVLVDLRTDPVGDLRTGLVEGHHIGLAERRTDLEGHHIHREPGGWSSRPWNRNYGQWHQGVA